MILEQVQIAGFWCCPHLVRDAWEFMSPEVLTAHDPIEEIFVRPDPSSVPRIWRTLAKVPIPAAECTEAARFCGWVG